MPNIKRGMMGASGSSSAGSQLWAWGTNNYGKLGTGNETHYSSPVQVGGLATWAYIAHRDLSGFAINSDYTLWSWGYNNAGQLGHGNTTSISSPGQVGSLTDWSKVWTGEGGHSTAAVKTDGTLWTWGSNAYVQLGLGDNTDRSSPVQVGALTNWSTVAVGQSHMLAIKTDGTLWGWGRADYGALGSGSEAAQSSPIQIGALTNWLQVTALGNIASAAVKTDGTLWSWGFAHAGCTGLGNTTKYSSPVQVGSLTDWAQVSGRSFSCGAVKTDGTLWSWGKNNSGQLGIGDRTDRSSPCQVGALTTWSKVQLGHGHFAALKTDGTIWGAGVAAGMGNSDSVTNHCSPVQAGAESDWTDLRCGRSAVIALK